MKQKDTLYDNRLVKKPWGYEYVVYRNKNNLSVTLLKINTNQTTSLLLSPTKKKWIYFIEWKGNISTWFMEEKIQKYIHHPLNG